MTGEIVTENPAARGRFGSCRSPRSGAASDSKALRHAKPERLARPSAPLARGQGEPPRRLSLALRLVGPGALRGRTPQEGPTRSPHARRRREVSGRHGERASPGVYFVGRGTLGLGGPVRVSEVEHTSLELVRGRTELLSEPAATRGRGPRQRQVRATLASAWMRGKRGERGGRGERRRPRPSPYCYLPRRRGGQSGRGAALGADSGRDSDPTGERGGREQTRRKPALTSSVAPSPGGVLAADVFHKVQNDKKPRNQSQVHSNPVIVPFLFSFFPFGC